MLYRLRVRNGTLMDYELIPQMHSNNTCPKIVNLEYMQTYIYSYFGSNFFKRQFVICDTFPLRETTAMTIESILNREFNRGYS